MTAVRRFRTDIQGLRGVAVVLVLTYHLWPELVPGGFVGVDVFFVISGYLITSILARELHTSGTIQIGRFYGRRVRRLLPASAAVLIFTAFASLWLAPPSMLWDIGEDVLASAVYVQNWNLAYRAVDYLQSEQLPGPLQHFWSLAIEEQFYLLWPFLLLIAARLPIGRPIDFGNRMAMAAAAVTTLSFIAGYTLTRFDGAFAYFASHARFWELGIGALLAVHRLDAGPISRRMASWGGLLLILSSAFALSAETHFPGHAALAPTLGAALVIWGGEGDNRSVAFRLVANRSMQWFGDISYSLYLWHWVVISFFRFKSPEGLGVETSMVALVLSVLLAVLSKRWVEDRFRLTGGTRSVGVARSGIGAEGVLPILGFATLASAVPALFLFLSVSTKAEQVTSKATTVAYQGALALKSGVQAPPDAPVIPPLESARRDIPDVYSNGCHQQPAEDKATGCQIGDPGGQLLWILVGDSHAANWVPALSEIGRSNRISVMSFTKSACALTLEDPDLRGDAYHQCTAWSRDVIEKIKIMDADLILLGRSRSARLHGEKEI